MNYTLIIAEKRAAAERIAEALDDYHHPSRCQAQGITYFDVNNNGNRLLVVPAAGHLYTIAPEQEERFRYPIFNVKWTPAYLSDKRLMYTKRWIDVFSKLSEKASGFISGTDNDIEGEVIGYTILKYACGDKEKKAKRMIFSTLTDEELKKSYENITSEINFALIESGETRHIVDFLWGINLSRALSLAVSNIGERYTNLSTGRVQAPTLKSLVDREKEIQNFVPTPQFSIHAKVTIRKRLYDGTYSQTWINDEAKAKKIVKKCSQQRGVISNIIVKTSKLSPPVPFDLGTLQADSYRLFRYSPSLTLRSAENLYLQALISYPRTSSQKLPSDINYRNILSSLGRVPDYRELTDKLLLKKRLRPNNGIKDDPAHPAIYPTGILAQRRLDEVSQKIFDLIIKRFLAIFGSPAVRESIKVSLNVSGETFYLSGIRTLNSGWLEFYQPYARTEETYIPLFSIGESALFRNVHYHHGLTPPPSRYNPSSLLKLMAEQNIGTKATRAQIIDTLYERGYIIDERMIVTDLGFKVVETLEKYCQSVVSPEFTRFLDDQMKKIEQGLAKKRDVLEESMNKLRTILTEFKLNENKIGLELSDAVRKTQMKKNVIGRCPICKTGNLIVCYTKKTGKRFAGCSDFSEGLCKAAFSLPQLPYRIKLIRKTCKKCSWPMIAVTSKGKGFWNLCLNSNCSSKKQLTGYRQQTK